MLAVPVAPAEILATANSRLTTPQSGLVARWALDVPTAAANAEQALQELLAKITGDAGIRARAALDELIARRQDVARAAGDPIALAFLEAYDLGALHARGPRR